MSALAGPLLVTGAGGLLGRAVAARADELELAAVTHGGRAAGDLASPGVADRLIATHAPAAVVHCAGVTYGGAAELYRGNVLSVVRLLDAVATHARDCRVVLIGSAAEYGLGEPPQRFAEDDRCAPNSDYGRSKLAATHLALGSGLAVSVGRPFNVTTAVPDPRTLLGRLHAAYAAGEREPGGADAVRDFVTATEVAAVLVALACAPTAVGIINICSGTPRSGAEQCGRPAPASTGSWAVGDPSRLASLLAAAGLPALSGA